MTDNLRKLDIIASCGLWTLVLILLLSSYSYIILLLCSHTIDRVLITLSFLNKDGSF